MFQGTPRQRRAQLKQLCIELRLARQEKDWRAISRHLATVDSERLFEEMDFSNLGDWAESIHISRSMAYDLVTIENSPHRDLLRTLKISHQRLMLPKLVELAEEPDKAADLINDISELKWHDARQLLYGDDPALRVYVVKCPSCGKTLKASRTVTLEVGH